MNHASVTQPVRRRSYRVKLRLREPSWNDGVPWVCIVAFLAAHILLAPAVKFLPLLGTVHALVVLGVGAYFAVRGERTYLVAAALVYIATAEVFWRMSNSQVVWEFGKFAVSFIVILSVVQGRHRQIPWQALAYFLVLLPSCILTLAGLSLADARNAFSFNLAGPLSLALSIWFFYRIRLTSGDFVKVLLCGIGPVVSVMAWVILDILSRPTLAFKGESNFATSGGFGPNQVSATLGLGALLAFFYVLFESRSVLSRITALLCMLGFAGQSALTFSRGGLYAATGGAVMALPFLLKNTKMLFATIVVLPIILFLSAFVIIPWLNAFTGGTLQARFEDTETSHRDELMDADLEVWREHVWLGVGPGMADQYRGSSVKVAASHTEFTRLLSEHGSFGALGVLLLAGLFIQRFLENRSDPERALMAGLTAWGCLFMMTSGMRLVAPSVMIGLGGIVLQQVRRINCKLSYRPA